MYMESFTSGEAAETKRTNEGCASYAGKVCWSEILSAGVKEEGEWMRLYGGQRPLGWFDSNTLSSP